MSEPTFVAHKLVVFRPGRPTNEQFLQEIPERGPVIAWGPAETARHFRDGFGADALVKKHMPDARVCIMTVTMTLQPYIDEAIQPT